MATQYCTSQLARYIESMIPERFTWLDETTDPFIIKVIDLTWTYMQKETVVVPSLVTNSRNSWLLGNEDKIVPALAWAHVSHLVFQIDKIPSSYWKVNGVEYT